MHGSERIRVSDGNTTINYEAASTAVETSVVVVAAAVDVAAAPEAGNSGSGCSSGSGDVDVGGGGMAVTIATATLTVTALMTTTSGRRLQRRRRRQRQAQTAISDDDSNRDSGGGGGGDDEDGSGGGGGYGNSDDNSDDGCSTSCESEVVQGCRALRGVKLCTALGKSAFPTALKYSDQKVPERVSENHKKDFLRMTSQFGKSFGVSEGAVVPMLRSTVTRTQGEKKPKSAWLRPRPHWSRPSESPKRHSSRGRQGNRHPIRPTPSSPPWR